MQIPSAGVFVFFPVLSYLFAKEIKFTMTGNLLSMPAHPIPLWHFFFRVVVEAY